jgi:hypothetical protein
MIKALYQGGDLALKALRVEFLYGFNAVFSGKQGIPGL